MGFSRQEYWSGLPVLSPGDLPGPGIEPVSFMSLALAGGFFTTSTTEAGILQPPFFFALSGSANKRWKETVGGIATSLSFLRLSTPSQ